MKSPTAVVILSYLLILVLVVVEAGVVANEVFDIDGVVKEVFEKVKVLRRVVFSTLLVDDSVVKAGASCWRSKRRERTGGRFGSSLRGRIKSVMIESKDEDVRIGGTWTRAHKEWGS